MHIDPDLRTRIAAVEGNSAVAHEFKASPGFPALRAQMGISVKHEGVEDAGRGKRPQSGKNPIVGTARNFTSPLNG